MRFTQAGEELRSANEMQIARSGSCRLEEGVWLHTQWFNSKYQSHGVRSPPVVVVVVGGINPDCILTDCIRMALSTSSVAAPPTAWSRSIALREAARASCSHRVMLNSLRRSVPLSGGFTVARLITWEDQKIRQGQSWRVGWACSCQHPANDALRRPGISPGPPVCSCSLTLVQEFHLKPQKRPRSARGLCGVLLWAANQRLATWCTKASQRSLKWISSSTGDPVCSEPPRSGSACPRFNGI